MLLKALDNVETGYMEMLYNRLGRLQRPEHAFTSELYHQLRKLQENNKNLQNLKFHVDLTKMSYNGRNKCIFKINKRNVRPDIVLHDSHNSTNHQELVVEVKMDGTEPIKIIDDLLKLLYYKLSNLHFKNCILIYTGSLSNIEGILSRFLSENIKKCLIKHGICVAVRTQVSQTSGGWNLYRFVHNSNN
jgi:hypothetical protein